MRCPSCNRALPYGAKATNASVRCIFCGVDFRAPKEGEQSPPRNPHTPSAAVKANASPDAGAGTRLRFINNRYALGPNPRQGGMALVYRANDMLDENRQVAVKILRHDKIEQPILAEAFKRETQALKELDHAGIVKLLDSGVDGETGEYFLVFEWMETDLALRLKSAPPKGWDEFASAVALPILEALSFAHSRNIVHRDLKPSNILIDRDGRPRLADFGISKLKRWLKPGLTLADWVSRPYTPREYDDGSFTYTRDVFAFGVVVLECLTDVELDDYESVANAQKKLGVPPEIRAILDRALSDDPAERQPNANILLSEIRAVQQKRERTQRPRRPCYLELSPKALAALRAETELESDAAVRNILLEDLNTECGIVPYKLLNAPLGEAFPPGQYQISGVSYRYHVKVNEPRFDRLIVFKAWRSPHSMLEQNRDRAWIPPYEFRFGEPLNVADARDVIRELQLAVDEDQADRRAREAEERERRLYLTWRGILQAKGDLEKSRQSPLRYNGVRVERGRAFFQLIDLPGDDLVGQPRSVRLPNGHYLAGEVDDVRERTLALYVTFGDPNLAPSSGELVL